MARVDELCVPLLRPSQPLEECVFYENSLLSMLEAGPLRQELHVQGSAEWFSGWHQEDECGGV